MCLDDSLIIGKTLEECLENIARVLNRLQEAGLKLKSSDKSSIWNTQFLIKGIYMIQIR